MIIHKQKKTNNHNSPNAILASFENKLKIGDWGATILLKKKRVPKKMRKHPMLFLFKLSVFCVERLLLATIIHYKIKTTF